jgi:hypothetical protein
MSRTTPTSRTSSRESERAIVLRPRPSRTLLLWWPALHLFALATLCALGPPSPLLACGGLLLVLHSVARYPSSAAETLARGADGLWSVPALGLDGLSIGYRTRYTTFWVRLELVGAARPLDMLLLADQLDPESWRVLQAILRRRGSAPRIDRDGPADLR